MRPEPLRVAILIPRLHGGGAEFVAGQWADYLRSQGVEVTLVTTHGPAGAAATPVVALGAATFGGRVRELRGHLARSRYDVVLALMPHWNVLALLATRGVGPDRPAVVVSGRNVESVLRESQGLSYRLELLLARALYRFADGYLAISHPVAAEAASAYGIEASRLWVVPNPATGKLRTGFARPPRGHESPRGRTVTLTVPARLVPQKRPEIAVEVAAILADRHQVAASVDYFGTGAQLEAVRDLARRRGVEVRFLGWVEAWFEEAAPDAVVLLPSAAEGFGNVLVEAAGSGIASVASSRALGVADAIVPGVTGVLCLGSGADDFAVGVLEAMNLTPVHAASWLARFTPQASGRQLMHVLEAVSRSRGGPEHALPTVSMAAATVGSSPVTTTRRES